VYAAVLTLWLRFYCEHCASSRVQASWTAPHALTTTTAAAAATDATAGISSTAMVATASDYSTTAATSTATNADTTSNSTYTGTVGPAGLQWIELFDESSGLPYYFCAATGEAVWEKPAELTTAARAPEFEHPEDMVCYLDDATGGEYWYNVRTGETVWPS
jgi:outer membrane protein assembly factor BamB